jgi:Transposase DDE domain/Domain of unknown function (DUF4372)
MAAQKTIFAQVIEFLHPETLRRCVRRYRGDYKRQSFSCSDQFLAMAFAQMTYRESLRDIEACLQARPSLLYHMGFRGRVVRSTLADANETRDWRIYADLAHGLIKRGRRLYAGEDLGLELDQTVYAFDATTIELCLTLFPWAHFRRTKAAVKMHTLLDLRGSIPSFIAITDGKTHEVNVLDDLPLEPGAIYVVDRGYVDWRRLYRLHQAGAFFVIRAKDNLCFTRHVSAAFDPTTGVRSDQIGQLARPAAFAAFAAQLRKVRFWHVESARHFIYLTNLFTVPAHTVAALYRSRWQIELFFRWIKQNLHIRRFYGTSDNAVRTQLWIAICVYVLVAILKKQLKLPQSLHRILQIVSVTAFERVPLRELLMEQPLQDAEDDLLNLFCINE